jgi:hypothetical protein
MAGCKYQNGFFLVDPAQVEQVRLLPERKGLVAISRIFVEWNMAMLPLSILDVSFFLFPLKNVGSMGSYLIGSYLI